MSYTLCYGQFAGGVADGFKDAHLVQGVCVPAPNSAVLFLGVEGDGGAENTLVQTVCAAVPSTNAILGGGFSDGAAYNILQQSVCPPLPNTNNLLGGGASDGSAYNSLVQSACPPMPNANVIFSGGISEGSSSSILEQSVCPPLAIMGAVYSGGFEDGSSNSMIIQSVCPPLPNSAVTFSGGDDDGFSDNILIQSVCPPLPSTAITYGGGVADGFSDNTIVQSVCPPPLSTLVAYLGGDAEGSSSNELAQTGCFTLPIGLLSFNAECYDEEVRLEWIVATEVNNDYFSIERTSNGVDFQSIGTISGAGSSSQVTSYSFIDSDPLLYKTVYYRLRQTDFDGQSETFSLVAVDCDFANLVSISIYPNPNNGKFTIDCYDDGFEKEIIIYNHWGELIWESSTSEMIFTLDLGSIPAGMYMIHVYTHDKSIVKKVIIQQ